MSSSDGQRFGVRGRPLLGGFYPRYFGYYERVVAVYTHMSDQFSVFSTLAISCSEREALYVLEGLLEQDTKLEHREHTTDTHGYTEQLFGLCFLLGFSFMPRIRNLADQQLYRLSGSFPLRRLDRVFRATIDEELIAEQWDQLVRVAGSLKRRTARPHDIMRRLASSGPSDRLAKALTALGRVVKTIYILRYINDRRLRGRIQQQLNRGEARHALARRLFFADQGEFLKGDYEEVMNKASCLSLLSNAVTAWNIVEMSRIVDDLRRSGKEVLDEDLARVWPLARRHVIPYGTYRFRPPGVSPQTTTKPRPAARGCV
jgi:TnpA family transposase